MPRVINQVAWQGQDSRWGLFDFNMHYLNGCAKWHLEEKVFCPTRELTEKAMAPCSSTLAWKIPWTEEPDML